MKTVWFALAAALISVLIIDLLGYGGINWLCNWGTYIIGLVFIVILFIKNKERVKILIAQIIAFSMISFVIFIIGMWLHYEMKVEFYKPCWSSDSKKIAFCISKRIYKSSPTLFSSNNAEKVSEDNSLCIINADGSGFREIKKINKPTNEITWSGSGDIVFCLDNKITTINPDTSNDKELLIDKSTYVICPWLSFDKKYLGYISNTIMKNGTEKGECNLVIKDIKADKILVQEDLYDTKYNNRRVFYGSYNKDIIAYSMNSDMIVKSLDTGEENQFELGVSSHTNYYGWDGSGDYLNGDIYSINIKSNIIITNWDYTSHNQAVAPNREMGIESGVLGISIYNKNDDLQLKITPFSGKSYLFNIFALKMNPIEIAKTRKTKIEIQDISHLNVGQVMCWSPDSKRIAFIVSGAELEKSQWSDKKQYAHGWYLCVMDYTCDNAKIVKKLEASVYASFTMSWSGSGYLVFTINDSYRRAPGIYKIDPDGNGHEKLIGRAAAYPWLSYDKNYLGYFDDKGYYAILDLTKKEQIENRKITNLIGGAYNKNKIAYYDQNNLMIYDIDTNKTTLIDMFDYQVKYVGIIQFSGWDYSGRYIIGKCGLFDVDKQIPEYRNYGTYYHEPLSPNAEMTAMKYGDGAIIITDRSGEIIIGKKALSKEGEKVISGQEFQKRFKSVPKTITEYTQNISENTSVADRKWVISSHNDSPVGLLDSSERYCSYKLLAEFGLTTRLIRINDLKSAYQYQTLLISSKGLSELRNDKHIKQFLNEYVSKGGTIICFTQNHGYDFNMLPGWNANEYNYIEESKNAEKTAYIDNKSPLYDGKSQPPFKVSANGYFDKYPKRTRILIRRVKSNMPVMIEYNFQKGSVIVSTLCTDLLTKYTYKEEKTYLEEELLIKKIIEYPLNSSNHLKLEQKVSEREDQDKMKASTLGLLACEMGYEAYVLLQKIGIETRLIRLDDLNKAYQFPALLIASTGLSVFNNSNDMKNFFKKYVSEGGTIICFTQLDGNSYNCLPGWVAEEYGYVADEALTSMKVYKGKDSPMLNEQDESNYQACVYGFFNSYPKKTKILLRSAKNDKPIMIEYNYGQGKVIASTLGSDYGNKINKTTMEEELLVKQIAKYGLNIKVTQK